MEKDLKNLPLDFILAVKVLHLLGWEFDETITKIRRKGESTWHDLPGMPHDSLDDCLSLLLDGVEAATGMRLDILRPYENGYWECRFRRDVTAKAETAQGAIIRAAYKVLVPGNETERE